MQRSLLHNYNATAEQRKSRRGFPFQVLPSDIDAVLDSIQEHSGEIQTDDTSLDDVKYQVLDIHHYMRCNEASTSDVTPVSGSPTLSPNVSRRPSLSSLGGWQLPSSDTDIISPSQSHFTASNVSRRPSLSLGCNETLPIEHRVVKFKYQWGEYEGQMQGEVMQGKGLFKYGENDVYDGEWKDNRRHGRGVRRWPNGEEYSGDWAKGVKHGKGILKHADGSVLYDGEWEFGRKEGKGMMIYPNGDVYEGEWMYGNRNGKGIFTTANGDVYDGHWNEDKKHGTGILDCSDGRSYRGEWVRDTMNGQFVCKFSNGSIYQGEIRLGKMHGHGVMKYANGLTSYLVYEGEFADDKRNGFGTMTYTKGDVYQGEWKDDNFVNSSRSPCISRLSSRSNLAAIGHMVSQKHFDNDHNDNSRSPCISRRSSRSNFASIGHTVSQNYFDTDHNDNSRSPCISRRSSRNNLDSVLYDSVDTLSRRNSITHSQCSTPTHDNDHDLEHNHNNRSPHVHAHSHDEGILIADNTVEGAVLNLSNIKGLLDSLDNKLSNCHSTAAALKDEQLAIMKRMKKKEKDNDFLEEREMFQLEYDVQELEDQKQVLEYTRRTSVSNAAAIRALFANDEKLNNNL